MARRKTEAQLFRQLRIIDYAFGLVLVAMAIVIAFFFKKPIDESWYQFILLFFGILLINYASQKYFQENPKIFRIVLWVLVLISLAGLLVLALFL